MQCVQNSNSNNMSDDYSLWINEIYDSNAIRIGGRNWEFSVISGIVLFKVVLK